MIMKKIDRIFFVLVFVLSVFIWSCTERIDLDLNNQEFERLVVDGVITTDTMAHTVELMLTTDYFYNQVPPRATGAVVSITCNSQSYLLNEVEPGVYKTDSTVYGEIGKVYTLHINYNNIDYEASCLLKGTINADSIHAEPVDEEDYKKYFEITYYGYEPETTGDYYKWLLYRNDTLLTDTLNEVVFESDELVNGSYMNGLPIYWVRGISGDDIRLETWAVPKEYYDFMLSLMLETEWNGGPMSGPPANIKGNVNNGALGFFLAADVKKNYTVLPQKD